MTVGIFPFRYRIEEALFRAIIEAMFACRLSMVTIPMPNWIVVCGFGRVIDMRFYCVHLALFGKCLDDF